MTELTNSNAELDYGIHYRAFHDESDEHAENMSRWTVDGISELLPKELNARCLDVGAGMGFAMLGLKTLGFIDVHGIDIDRSQVEGATKRGLSVELVIDTVGYLHNKADNYDVIMMLDVLEHISVSEQIRFLRAVYSALRPGGRIILQVPNANAAVASRWRYIDFTHTSSFTEHSLSFVLANSGFIDISVPKAADPQFPRLPRRFWRLTNWKAFLFGFRRWLARFIWRQLLIAEIGEGRGQDNISLAYNLVAVGFKPNAN